MNTSIQGDFQIYISVPLKQSEAIANFLASMIGLKDLISQSELLNAICRRTKQENNSVDKHFVRNPDELLNFFCENNTDITWSDVDDTLIDYVKSRTQISGIKIII